MGTWSPWRLLKDGSVALGGGRRQSSAELLQFSSRHFTSDHQSLQLFFQLSEKNGRLASAGPVAFPLQRPRFHVAQPAWRSREKKQTSPLNASKHTDEGLEKPAAFQMKAAEMRGNARLRAWKM